MAFTAAYWALDVFKPKNMVFLGCDMIYSGTSNHFYGTGTADPLRDDLTLRSLEAKSARFEVFAKMQSCVPLNLSNLKNSRLVYDRVKLRDIAKKNRHDTRQFDYKKIKAAQLKEESLRYFIEDGKYWKCFDRFDQKEIDVLDNLWLSSIITNHKSSINSF